MKTKMYFVILLLAITFISIGCGPFFGNVNQYRKGDWYGVADEKQVARMEQDKLALEKLKAQPVLTATSESSGSTATKGYKGLVVNRSKSSGYACEVFGPEKKSWFLEPESRFEDYLIPGWYRYEIRRAGKKEGWGEFHVGPQIKIYDGQKYHWFFGADH